MGNMSLNPYCSGQWPRTEISGEEEVSEGVVLILIVVDNGLVQDDFDAVEQTILVLILIVVDNGLVLTSRVLVYLFIQMS